MIPYIALFLAVSICLLISSMTGLNYAFYLAGFFLTMFSALRYNIGKDYENYNQAFLDIAKTTDTYGYEYLNIILIKTVNFIGGTPQLVFATYAAVTMFCVFMFIKRLSNAKELSAFAFMCIGIFYFATFNQVRQWAALAMILCAVIFLAEHKNIRSYSFVVMAMMFHMSAAVFIVIPLLTKRYSKKFLFTLLLSSGLIGKIGLLLVQKSYYFRYLEALRSDSVGSPALIGGYLLSITASIFALGYFNKDRNLSRPEIILLNMCWVSLLILLSGFSAGVDFAYVMRINMYFSIQLLALIPLLIRQLTLPFQYFAYPSAAAALSYLYFSTLQMKGNIYVLTPFKTWPN